MGLKKKVKEIAIEAANQTVETIMPTLVQQIAQANTNFIGKVVRSTGQNEYIVLDANGNERTVTYTGDRPIGKGSGINVNGNYAT